MGSKLIFNNFSIFDILRPVRIEPRTAAPVRRFERACPLAVKEKIGDSIPKLIPGSFNIMLVLLVFCLFDYACWPKIEKYKFQNPS